MKKIMYRVLFFMALLLITSCGNGKEDESEGGEVSDREIQTVTQTTGAEQENLERENSENAEQENPEQENAEQEETGMKMQVQVGDTVFTATLAENSSVDALLELMADEPLTLNMSDYANMEKGADLGVILPQNNEQMNTQAGDLILYQGRTFVIYYDTNSWSLTPIGKIDHVDAEELREVLGTGDVTVTLSLE